MSTHDTAAHFDGTRFFTPGAPPLPTWRDILRWNFDRGQRVKWPKAVALPEIPQTLGDRSAPSSATWIGHSTFLIRHPGFTLLTDPVFSSAAGPFGKIGPRRAHPPGRPLHTLPKIDAVFLSHDHYDHCDLPTLSHLAKRDAPLAITPLGNGDLLRRAGFTRIVELDWWQSHRLTPDIQVTVTPSQHWSNRITGSRCGRLWGGFFWEHGAQKTYFVGDTGWHPTFFSSIRKRLGEPDLAFVPIGAYEPRWFMAPQHVNPVEAVRIHTEVAAKQSLAMHWGTFCLTDEGREDPPRHLAEALTAASIPLSSFMALAPGDVYHY